MSSNLDIWRDWELFERVLVDAATSLLPAATVVPDASKSAQIPRLVARNNDLLLTPQRLF